MFVERLNSFDIEKICGKVLGRLNPYIDEMPNTVDIDRSTPFAVKFSWSNSSFLFPQKYIVSITDFDIKFYGFEFDENVVEKIKSVYLTFMKNRFKNFQEEYELNREEQKEYSIKID